MAGRWDTLTVDGSAMRCFVSVPEGTGPFPAVVVCMHAGGVDNFVQTMADRFAAAGYVAIAPDLYHREGPNTRDDPLTRMRRLRDATIIRDGNAAVEHLQSLPNVRAGCIGIAGFCMGGRVAYLMAVHNPDLKAAVVFYGGNIMQPWGEGPSPFDGTARIQCPVLGLFGEEDPNPSPADVAKLDAELTRLGKVHEFHTYPGAGHAFMNFERPSFRQHASVDTWAKCLDWLARYLA